MQVCFKCFSCIGREGVCACVSVCVCCVCVYVRACVFACEFVRRGRFEVVLGLWFEGTFRFVVAVVVVSFCTLGSD